MVSVPKARPAFPEQFRREAIELLRAGRTPRELSESLGVSQQTLRNWRRQDQVDRHERDDGLTSDEREELRRLRRENARLTQERDLLKRAAAWRRWWACRGYGDGLTGSLALARPGRASSIGPGSAAGDPPPIR
jgi:transposase